MGKVRRFSICLTVLLAVAGPSAAFAGGDVYGAEPVPQAPFAGPPNDAVEAYAEAEFVNGDPYGRSDYWQDGRGNRLGTQFGPGFYQKGYYYPSERQFPDYAEYDRRRGGPGSLWRVAYEGVVDPFMPYQDEIDFARAAPMRVITKLRIDEDLRRLHAMAKAAMKDDGWAGGRFDSPRPLK